MSKQKFAEQIKQTILEFFDALKTIFDDFVELDMGLIFFRSLSDNQIADYSVSHVLPYKNHIIKKDAHFFITNRETIFSKLPKEKVEEFAKMLLSPDSTGGLSKENKDIIWQYFNVIVILCEKYKKNP